MQGLDVLLQKPPAEVWSLAGARPLKRARQPHDDRWRTMTNAQQARCTYSQTEQDEITRKLIADGVFKPL